VQAGRTAESSVLTQNTVTEVALSPCHKSQTEQSWQCRNVVSKPVVFATFKGMKTFPTCMHHTQSVLKFYDRFALFLLYRIFIHPLKTIFCCWHSISPLYLGATLIFRADL
jgi:hypothetical protein